MVALNQETEWAEFKHNSIKPEDLGEYISALANSAALLGKPFAYLIWGVKNLNHDIVGTNFNPVTARHKQQELESWLLQKMEPKIDFCFHSFEAPNQKSVVILEIQAASYTPVRFSGTEFIRIGSYKKPLGKHPEKERYLWRVFDRKPFEHQLAMENVTAEEVLKLILTRQNNTRYFCGNML
ncbi:MAG: ATP-binding protein [Desulfobacteraceae bacterium]|nr:ATP-binding protein [Desulfobacteraceae bacterium]